MVWHSLSGINDTNHSRLQLQLLPQFARDCGCGLFIAIEPSTGQAPGKARMISVFDQQYTSIVVEDDGGDADRITCLRPADYTIG